MAQHSQPYFSPRWRQLSSTVQLRSRFHSVSAASFAITALLLGFPEIANSTPQFAQNNLISAIEPTSTEPISTLRDTPVRETGLPTAICPATPNRMTAAIAPGTVAVSDPSTSATTPDAAAAPDTTGEADVELPPQLQTHLSARLMPWMESIQPIFSALIQAPPLPDIHERARLARVPVMMYHDILPEKEVFFDVTPEEFEQQLQQIRDNGLTPISLDQLVEHLNTGMPLPDKPILLTFDDGYEGHYTYVYPLLKKYGYPAVFSIYTSKVGTDFGRSSVNWEQLREMAADPLITIASHSVTHPLDLRELPPDQIRQEVVESKEILERELGIEIKYFTYPVGKYNEEVLREVEAAGYEAALTMRDREEFFAGDSETLLSIERIGQSRLDWAIEEAWGGPSLPNDFQRFSFNTPINMHRVVVDDIPLTLVFGGRPMTIHADSRYQVPEIIEGTGAIAAVDGGFFSLKYLDSNTMIGPVFSQFTRAFVPGNASENPRLLNRPLVIITPETVEFIPFDPDQHNTLEGIQASHPTVTDAFVAAAWLVKDGQPRDEFSFGNLFDFDANRHRAFWGIDYNGRPVIGVSTDRVDSIRLGEILSQLGFRDAVMLDSGASTSLAYRGEQMVPYEPRPVPHVVALMPPVAIAADGTPCLVASQYDLPQQEEDQ